MKQKPLRNFTHITQFQNYTIKRSNVDILAGANANPVHCSLLKVLGRSRGFGADWTSRGEKADGPWWDQELPPETSGSQVAECFWPMSPPRWDTQKSLSKFSFRILITMSISLLLLKQWITFAGWDLMILKKDAGQVKICWTFAGRCWSQRENRWSS